MKLFRWITLTALLLMTSIAALSQTFTLNPITLANGWVVTGNITTDGTIGPLAPANILDWNLKVAQTTDFTWTERDSNDFNISGVSTDGKNIHVATSPDGILDGGTLFFSRGGGGGTIPTSAIIADFTQLSVNLGYLHGLAGWQDEIWGLNFVGLTKGYNQQYHAAALVPGKTNVFKINMPLISKSPLLMSMFGTVTTDGTIGPLLPKNIVAWNVVARNQDITNYNKLNTTLLSTVGVSSDGLLLKVDHAGGQFMIGVGGFRPTYVTIADFTDPAYPNGFSNYYVGWFGVEGDKFPLTAQRAKTFIVARKP